MAARLRQLLAAPGLIRAVNVYDPLTARIADSLGFQAIALGGFQLGAPLCTTEPILTLTDRAPRGRGRDAGMDRDAYRLAGVLPYRRRDDGAGVMPSIAALLLGHSYSATVEP